jgi:hypothetical protein
MTTEPAAAPVTNARRIPAMVAVAILAVVVWVLAISNQSFWIDEAGTAHKAMTPTLAGWWERLRVEGTSNLQLPLYLLYAWTWEKLVGPAEWAMRAGNIPWILLAVVVVAKLFTASPPLRVASSVVLLINAFVWYYLDEARPYSMQIGASVLVFGALYRLTSKPDTDRQGERRWVWALSVGTMALCASGLLAMIWCGAALAAAALICERIKLKRLCSEYCLPGMVAGVFLLVLGLYYLWTVKIGARATILGTTDSRNVLFIFHELLGFNGAGPGRSEIRAGGLKAFESYLSALLIQGVLTVVVLGAGARQLVSTHRARSILAVALFLSAVGVFLLGVGHVAGFRILGRHCAPLLVPLLFVSALGVASLWAGSRGFARIVVVAYLCSQMYSCLSVRFARRHAKDDYRSAATLARGTLQAGKVVWWSADVDAAVVYGLPTTSTPGENGKALLVVNPVKGFDAGLAAPDLILASRPDAYDLGGMLAGYVAARGYRCVASLPSFKVWRMND